MFQVWTKRTGYAKWFWTHSIGNRMPADSPGKRTGAGRNSTACSGQ
jgi:hypothetical protein